MAVENLLNFNGIDGTQVFTDSGLTPATWVVENGSPVLSNTQSKFGGTSLFLDGSSNLITTDFDLGDSTQTVWTLECWVYMSNPLPTSQVILNFDNTTLRGLYYTINNNGSFVWYDNAGRTPVDVRQTPIQPDQWYHLVVTNNKGVINLYCNGVRSESTYNSTFDYTGHEVRIGKYGSGTILDTPFTGFIEDIRLTKDQILYNATIKPSDVPNSELTTTVIPMVNPTNVVLPEGLISYQTNIALGNLGGVILGDNSSNTTPPPPTSTNIISGNVKKLGLPFGATVACISLGLNAEILGTGLSDSITGDYSIDVYPHINEVLIYVAPDYGNSFISSTFVGTGSIIHPTIPNRYVYVAQNDGTVGSVEPTWITSGDITSGSVTFSTIPLHRPLMNGFVKPVITPI